MKTFILVLALISSTAVAAPIAIIDSGTDLKHNDLATKAWINSGETPDNDADDEGNGYADDVFGWNFAENNNQIIDYKYLGTFSHDVYKFFDIQYRIVTETATAEDKTWYKAKLGDENFIKELSKFGNFIHGTHVAGITANGANDAKIMGVKLIPTEVNASFFDTGLIKKAHAMRANEESADPFTDLLIKMGLDKLADQQMKILTTIGQYVAQQKMRVANCSFGTSMPQARMIMRQLLPMVLQRDPTNEEVETYAKYFINKVIEKGKGFVDAAKDTFFVIAAGNDGLNNDEYPVSPANIKQNNTITVAATFEHKKIASFSNYGINMVDVAAPGVGINSTIPGNEYLRVSGTSQATPYVAGVIGQLMDINPKLSFSDIRTIVMLTVDKKDYLASKVKAGGIINSERAKEAAKLSLGMSLDTAIEKARATVLDEMVVNSIKKEGFVIPLTPMFILR